MRKANFSSPLHQALSVLDINEETDTVYEYMSVLEIQTEQTICMDA
jgi:hypothetical protein